MFELLIVVIFNVVFVFGLLKDYGFLLCGKYVDLVIIDVLRLEKLFFKFLYRISYNIKKNYEYWYL